MRHITYDDCVKFMQEHQGITRTELRKNHRIYYERMSRQGWIDELAPIPRVFTEEYVKKIISQYETLEDLKRDHIGVYSWVNKHNKMHLVDGLKKKACLRKRGIYAYEFPDHSVYVGLTRNFVERDQEHRLVAKSTVHKHSIEIGCEIPLLKQLTQIELSSDEAAIEEGKWVDKYKEGGWIILNKIRTGGLGGYHIGKKKFTKEEFAEIIKPYRHRTELSKHNHWAFIYGIRTGWLDELMPPLHKSERTRDEWTIKEYRDV